MSEPIDLRFVAEDVGAGTWLQWAPSFDNVKDLVDKAIAAAGDRCIRRLVIAGHGAENGGFMVFDGGTTGVQVINGSYVDPSVKAEFERLKAHMCDQAIVELRVCNFGFGRAGSKAANALANLLGVPVTAPQDEIKALGLVGGLTVDWFTAYPDDWGKQDVTSFWVGEPEARPAGLTPLLPIQQAYVPAPEVTPPDPIPEPVYGDPPVAGDGDHGAAADPAPVGGRRWQWWWVAVPALLLLLGLAYGLFGRGDDDPVADVASEPAGDATSAPDAAATSEPSSDATGGESPSAVPEPSPSPVAAAPREATVLQGGFGDSRAAARGWYQRAIMIAVTQDAAFWELWFGTYPGSVVMFNAYGPPGSIPAIEDWNEETAAAVEEQVLAHVTEGPEGAEVDWAGLLAALGADPTEVCAARIVLDLEADRGGDLPGYDADGNLAGSGPYTGQTDACTGDFEISLEATIAP